MANPATKLVPLLRKQRAMQSLQVRCGGGNRQVRKGCSVWGLQSRAQAAPGQPCPSQQAGQRQLPSGVKMRTQGWFSPSLH